MFKQIQTTRFHLLCALLPVRVHPKFLSPRSILFPTIKLFTLPFAFLRSIFRRSMLPLSVPCVCCGFVLVTPSFVTSKHEILELHCLSACVFYVAVDTLCVCFLSLGSQQASNMQIHSSNQSLELTHTLTPNGLEAKFGRVNFRRSSAELSPQFRLLRGPLL